MPNGQTDVFTMQRSELLRLLETHRGETLRTYTVGEENWKEAAALSVADWARRHPDESVKVEEQHGTHYIIHLGREFEYWIEIGPQCALYLELRRVLRVDEK